jgi:aerobic carbon-monoxide dehydrogenase large subunit
MKFGIGQSVPRTEDPRLLTGRGRFTDNFDLPGQLHAAFTRSPHAHATVRIDPAPALAVPGVVRVLTGADLDAAGVRHLHSHSPIRAEWPGRPVLATTARHVGEAVALVLAETREAARDGAEALGLDWTPHAPRIGWANGEVAFTWRQGDAAAVDRAFAAAARVVRHQVHHNRIAVVPMEPRALLAEWDAGEGRLTMRAQTQGVHALQEDLATALGLDLTAVRVLTGDVGGGFGGRIYAYPEHVAVAHAARVLAHPVKWLAERGECFATDHAGRGHDTLVELALDEGARFTALRFTWMSDLGAYVTTAGPGVPTVYGSRVVTGCYAIPVQEAIAEGRTTTTVPVDAYRGAGKPEAHYALERAVDEAAHALGMDPLELRRRNLVRADQMPWRNAQGQVFDSGDFPGLLHDATAGDGFPARAAAARTEGKVLGRGIGMYVEPSGARDGRVSLAFRPDGTVVCTVTAQANGQGHETAFAQVVAEQLGLPIARIKVVQGDSDLSVSGSGSGGSRSMTVAAVGILRTSQVILAKARRIAAHLLEASEADLEFQDGRFTIAGTDRVMTLQAIAAASFQPAKLSPGEDQGLEASVHHTQPVANFPSGCHVAEVLLDPETGALTLTRYSALNDFGTVVNPKLLEGQVAGGVVQGIGQALLENQAYDRVTGQLLAGSLMDYALPRAADLPGLDLGLRPTACTTNPLGIKGCGEAGCSGSLPAVMNAVNHALRQAGGTTVDMPATPQAVWRALKPT